MIAKVMGTTRFALLRFRRNPAATFFTVIFPLLFLVIFGYVFGNDTMDSGAKVATFIVPGILTMSIVSATFFNLAIGLVVRRESGELKRLRGTPMPPIAWVLGQVLASFVLVVMMTILVTLGGRVLFDVTFNWSTLGAFVLFVLLGTMTFSALGMAVTALIPTVDAAPAITNLVVFPLYFVSDVFFRTENAEGFIGAIGDYFPVKPLSALVQPTYNPFVDSVQVDWSSVLTLALWGAAGVILAARFFRWTAQQDRG